VDPYNIYEQLENGLTESGFWYECSIHYNFFALEGLMTFLVFAKSYGHKIPNEYLEKVKKMLYAAYDYAFDNDIFPNPSDGWPNILLKTYSYVYFMAYKVFGEASILPLLKHICSGKLTRGKLPLSEPYYFKNEIPLEQILYAPDYEERECAPLYKRTSLNFIDYNCAILRNEKFNVFLKYGHQTKSHAHPDKMNVEIMVKDKVLTKDLSNSGYQTNICNNWDRTIAAHNTCAVNSLPTNVTEPGRVISYTNNCIEAEADCYDGVIYNRKLELRDDSLVDTFVVKCDQVSKIEWFFHFEEAVNKKNLTLIPVNNIFTEYSEIMNIRLVDMKQDILVLENSIVSMKLFIEEGASVYIADTYNNPANMLRDTIIIRKNDKTAMFKNITIAK